jgi:hypothetical protein
MSIRLIQKYTNESEKLELLKCDWTFSRSYVFAATAIRGVSRTFNNIWLEKYPWLHYSETDDGVFCLSHLLFTRRWQMKNGTFTIFNICLD